MTLHIEDIQFALEMNHVSVVEDAFRALVGWPNEDEIFGADCVQRGRLLEEVCRALASDHRQMPGNIVQRIEDNAHPLWGGMKGGSYADGAGEILVNIEYWREVVRQ